MKKAKIIATSLMFLFVISFTASPVSAKKPSEYEAVVKHLKSRYSAKKVKVPFLWLARFAVSVVRPAGVKSFSVTFFKDLKISKESIDTELQQALDRTYAEAWSPVFRIRSREGQQAYMYMREAGSNIRLTLVTIDKGQAAIIRATFSPEKLAEFTNDPKIFGMSLGDKKEPAAPVDKPAEVRVEK